MAILCLTLFGATACRVQGAVNVEVKPDGSGTIEAAVGLDQEAVNRIGGLDKIRVADLQAAGWKISPLTQKADKDGLLWVRASHAFASPDEVGPLLAEVGGQPALIDGARLSVDDGFATTDYRFTADFGESTGLAQFADPALSDLLDGYLTGRTDEELVAEGAFSEGVGSIELTVTMPGTITSSGGSGAGTTRSFSVPINRKKATTVDVTSEITQTVPRYLLYIGIGLVAVALVSLVIARRRISQVRELAATQR